MSDFKDNIERGVEKPLVEANANSKVGTITVNFSRSEAEVIGGSLNAMLAMKNCAAHETALKSAYAKLVAATKKAGSL